MSPRSVLLGTDAAGLALQVAVTDWTGTGSPTREAISALHKARLGKHVFPLIVLAVTAEQAWMLGPSPDAAVIGPLATRPGGATAAGSVGRADRARRAPASGDDAEGGGVHGAAGRGEHRALRDVLLDGLGATAGGLGEQGERSRPWMPERGERLIRALGFTAKKAAGSALLLTGGSEAPHAVAVLLDASEQFDQSSPRYQVSPVAWGLQVAARNEVPWLMVLRGTQIRLYPAKPGVGVGRKGQVETWFELDLALLGDDEAGLLGLVFSADALAPDGTVDDAARRQQAVRDRAG